MDKSGNPAFSKKALEKFGSIESSSTATISGTTIKIFILLLLTVGAGYFGWQGMANATTASVLLIAGSGILGFVTALITIFKPTIAYVTAPIYALAQGYMLGAISQMYNTQFNGIVIQAIGLTGALFFVSLWVFAVGLIKVTAKFRTGVLIATLGVGLYYLVAIVLGLFGVKAPLIFDTGTFGIVFSLIIIFIATLNLILDFDMIQRLEQQKAPKVFEWYGAFALMVTLIWLYTEVLRLLSKTRS